MEISILDTSSARWNAVLGCCRHDCCHTPGWLRAAEYGDRGKAYAVHATDGNAHLLVPFIRRELPGGDWDAVSPYGYGGPVVSDGTSRAFTDAALSKAVDVLREAGCVSWFIRLHPLINAGWESSVGAVIEQGPIVTIDLTKTEAEHWHETAHSHRCGIVKAKRAGVGVRVDTSLEAMIRFIELYNQSMSRLHALEYYYFDERYYMTLWQELGTDVQLFVAEEEGQIIGAGLLSVARAMGILQSHLFGADTRFLHRQPQKLLIHAQRAWGREHGHKRLILGGGRTCNGQAEDSLFSFKHRFSPDIHVFKTQRLIVNPQRYAALCGCGRADETPSGLDGYFPAYRRQEVALK